MEGLNETEWDIVIAGTGLQESLLALALTTSGKSVLHVDRNNYYGDSVAALNPQDAESWVQGVNHEYSAKSTFSSASITSPITSISTADSQSSVDSVSELGRLRQYNLSLSPHIFHARSAILNHLVEAGIHEQVDFVADGNTWLFSANSSTEGELQKVPSSREDVALNQALSLATRRSIIKFLRSIANNTEDKEAIIGAVTNQFFEFFLQQEFALGDHVQTPIHALTLSLQPPSRTMTPLALKRVQTHISSMNVLKPGIASVTPKWGGLAEIVQVMCRAQAVKGGVYVLGYGLESVQQSDVGQRPLELKLGGGNKVWCDWLVSGFDNTPSALKQNVNTAASSSHSISIVSSPLLKLFERPSEDSVDPCSSLTCVLGSADESPIHIVAHSSDTGDCPSGKCILYAQTAHPASFDTLESTVSSFIDQLDPTARVLWRLQYERRSHAETAMPTLLKPQERVLVFGPRTAELVFDEGAFDDVKEAWSTVVGVEGAEAGFMVFAKREEDAESL